MKVTKLIVLFICFCHSVQSQILKAGDLYFKNISGSTFRVDGHITIKWPLSINKPYLRINWGDGSPIDSLSYSGSFCTMYSSTTLEYSGYHTFPLNSTFTISVTDSFLVAGIYNIPNSSTQKLYIHTILNTGFLPNTIPFVAYGCLNDSVRCCNVAAYNPGCSEPDGDSISYALATPPFIVNYVLPPVVIDPITGTLTFTSKPPGLISVTMRIDEWRKVSNVSTLICSNYKELFFEVFNSVGIEENSIKNQIKIYPNPTTSTLNVTDEQNELQNSTIEITNEIGQTIINAPFNNSIDISRFAKGCYFITITTDKKEVLHSKFILE